MSKLKYNPRFKNGNYRRKMRARFKAAGLPCHICGKPIDYSLPSRPEFPLSFVIDEIKPVSRWREFGYDSPEAACMDAENLAPAHYACNALKSNHLPNETRPLKAVRMRHESDGKW